MLRKVVRRSLGLVKRWLDDGSDERPVFASPLYSWANPLYLEIIGDPACHHAYAWGIIQGVNLARSLGVGRVSVIEFGVAGGNGLIALERIAEKVERALGVGIDVYGFDTGTGLPRPEDYRDKPHLHSEGDFAMDQRKLQAQLKRARLVLGLVKDTISGFVESRPCPVTFVAFDLDFYSSTSHALRLLEADPGVLMPRIHCFFDDIFACGDYNGERLAISEFNASHETRKLSPIYGLKYFVPGRVAYRPYWEKNYAAYIFDHELCGRNEGLLDRRSLGLMVENR